MRIVVDLLSLVSDICDSDLIMVNYVLIEWESDNSVSVVPVNRLLSRNGKYATQKWGRRVYGGTILKESGKLYTDKHGWAAFFSFIFTT